MSRFANEDQAIDFELEVEAAAQQYDTVDDFLEEFDEDTTPEMEYKNHLTPKQKEFRNYFRNEVIKRLQKKESSNINNN